MELGCDSLTPIAAIEDRCRVWNSISGGGKGDIRFEYLDLHTDYAELVQVHVLCTIRNVPLPSLASLPRLSPFFEQLIKNEKPDSIVHFAEQRAAPYSMKNPRTKRYTIDNNLGGTHNLLCAIVESEVDVHVVHLGTVTAEAVIDWTHT